MPLSIEKTIVLQRGQLQPLFNYHIKGLGINSAHNFPDLGV